MIMMKRKGWMITFPRFHCPHCGQEIENIKFVGKFKLPRRGRGDNRGDGNFVPTDVDEDL